MLNLPDKKLTRLLIRHIVRDIKNRRHHALLSVGALIISSPRRPYAPRRLFHSSINRRLVYIPNPKCASVTIRDWLQIRELLLSENRFQRFIRISLLRRKWRHINKILDTFFPEGETPFLFSFVRNPFARHVSCYQDQVLRFRNDQAKKPNIRMPSVKNNMLLIHIIRSSSHLHSFEAFTLAVASSPDHYADEHIKSQYATLYENGNLIPDYVGKVENFDHDARYLCEQFNLPSPRKLNTSPATYDYREFYTPETVELVAKRYASDIQAFGYEEELEALRQYVARKA